MTEASGLIENFTRVDRSGFNPLFGVVAGIFVVTPLLLGFVVHQSVLIFTVLGTLLITLLGGGRPTALPVRILLIAYFTDAAAIGVGTLATTTGRTLSPILLAVSLFLILLTRGKINLGPCRDVHCTRFRLGNWANRGVIAGSRHQDNLRTCGWILGPSW